MAQGESRDACATRWAITRTDADANGGAFRTYAEAADAAARMAPKDGLVAKAQRSPYGGGYVVRLVPVQFLLDPELKRRFVRPVEYHQL